MTRRLRLDRGESARRTLEFREGTNDRQMSIGYNGDWSIAARGIRAVHAHCYFDGETLFVRSESERDPARIDGHAVPVEWTEVTGFFTLQLGEARLVLEPSPPQESRRSSSSHKRRPAAPRSAIAAGARRAPTPGRGDDEATLFAPLEERVLPPDEEATYPHRPVRAEARAPSPPREDGPGGRDASRPSPPEDLAAIAALAAELPASQARSATVVARRPRVPIWRRAPAMAALGGLSAMVVVLGLARLAPEDERGPVDLTTPAGAAAEQPSRPAPRAATSPTAAPTAAAPTAAAPTAAAPTAAALPPPPAAPMQPATPDTATARSAKASAASAGTPREAPPPRKGAKVAAPRTMQRLAVDAVVEGRQADALAAYRKLAATQPEEAYREAVRIYVAADRGAKRRAP